DRHLDTELAGFRTQRLDEVGVRALAVDVGLALAEKVQVGAVGDDDAFHASALRSTRRTIAGGTACPGSACPSRRGMTHATFPRRAFLSRGMAASPFARSTRGARSGSPYAVSIASCDSTSRLPHRSMATAIRAAARMPNATARPCEIRKPLAASSAWPAVWP